MTVIFETKYLAKSFGGVVAADNVTIKLNEGDIVTVMGPNGAGKTTLFNLITGIYQVDNGHVFLDGKDLTNKKQEEITRSGIARTFQNIRLFEGLTVLENVMCAHDPLIEYSIIQSAIGFGKKKKLDTQNRELSLSYLDAVGLSEFKDENPLSLPYGHQRRLEIARALATQPRVLLLDEPAAGLNTVEVQELITLLRKLKSIYNLSIILIDHRMELVMSLSDYIYVLNFGKQIAEGTPEEIQTNREVQSIYVGEES